MINQIKIPYNSKKKTLFDSIYLQLKKHKLTPVCVMIGKKYYDWEQYVKVIKKEKPSKLVFTDTRIICKEGQLIVINCYIHLWLEEQEWEFIPFYVPTEDEIDHKELSREDVILE